MITADELVNDSPEPSVATAVVFTMGDPPSSPGGVHDNRMLFTPGLGFTLVGASGGGTACPRGVTGGDDALQAPTPTAFTAATVNVYGVPFMRLWMVVDVDEVVLMVVPPGDAVTS